MFDRLIPLGFATVGFCRDDESAYWNYALTNKLLTFKQLLKIERLMKNLKRPSAIYFENKTFFMPLIELLKQNAYNFAYEDSWMFYQNQKIDANRFNQVKKVTNSSDLKIFLETFDRCYQKNDPQNAYSELGNYLAVTEKVWHQYSDSNRLEYFIVYKENVPVAVSTLTSYQKIGYISNVGSLKEVRGQGFGKTATLYCVQKSIDMGNIDHCLATEEKTYANEFYRRIGFATRFTAVCYKKDQKNENKT